jgi:hypothetical protein
MERGLRLQMMPCATLEAYVCAARELVIPLTLTLSPRRRDQASLLLVGLEPVGEVVDGLLEGELGLAAGVFLDAGDVHESVVAMVGAVTRCNRQVSVREASLN